jgi:hypothetical protein
MSFEKLRGWKWVGGMMVSWRGFWTKVASAILTRHLSYTRHLIYKSRYLSNLEDGGYLFLGNSKSFR